MFGFGQEFLDASVSRQLSVTPQCADKAPVSLRTDSCLGFILPSCNYLFAELILPQTMYFIRAEIVFACFRLLSTSLFPLAQCLTHFPQMCLN